MRAWRRGRDRRRLAAVAAVAGALVVVVAQVVVAGGDGRDGTAGGGGGGRAADGPRQSAAEIGELAEDLPGGLTPLDPAAPNPVGDDPAAIGAPPELPAPADDRGALVAAARAQVADAGPGEPPKTEPGGPDPGPQVAEDSLLVAFAPGTDPGAVRDALAAAGVEGTPIAGTDVVEVDTAGHDAADVAAALAAADGVESVDRHLRRSIARTPNDPEYPAQAPSLATAGVPLAWDVAATGSGAVVAVLDTGADLDHPDLAANLVGGRDVVNGDATPQDDHGHGTQVAGVIGAATDNGTGVAGVAWNARVMPVKVLDAGGNGTDADVAQGIVWATDHGADVINMSLGGPGASFVIDQAVQYALDHEVVLVAASGNAGSTTANYPAAAPGVLGVTATDAAGQFAWFSNHGPWISLAAPGIGIRTTALAAGPAAAYASGTGTSLASPIVAGTAALLAERHPGWGWSEVADELLRTARDAGPAGVDDEYGYGIVDAAAALGVRPVGPTSQPDRTGDAGDRASAARPLISGTAASEAIGHERDEDWFRFDVASPGGATVVVTPPPFTGPSRAGEMDPVVELHGPGGGLIARVDDTFEGGTEELRLNVGAGRHTLRVTNWFGSRSPAPYTVRVDVGPEQPPTDWRPWEAAYTTESSAQAVALADIDGDGDQDVALFAGFDHTTPQEDQYTLFVFRQRDDGTLSAPVKLPARGPTTPGIEHVRWSLTAADLDGDGDPDLALSSEPGIEVAWNDGGTFAAPVLYEAGGPVSWSTAADLVAGGPEELVVRGNIDDDALRSLAWDGTGFTVTPLGIEAAANVYAGLGHAVADVTNDGRPDIAAFVDAGVAIHPGEPDGGFGSPTVVPVDGVGPGTSSLTAGDVTDDGRADLVMVGGGNQPGPFLRYVVQQPDGSFGPATTLGSYDIPGPVKIGDVDADGRADAVVVHNGWQAVGVYRQTSAGTLAPEQLLPQPYATWYNHDGLALGDIDGDGVDDIVTANHNYGLVVVRHQGSPRPEGPGPWLAATAPAGHATGVATGTQPRVTFGRPMLGATVTGDSVLLLDGRTGGRVEAAVAFDGTAATLTPARPLQPGAPYQVVLAGVVDQAGTIMPLERIPFTTAPAGRPTYTASGTYTAFPLDLDGNGYEDIFFYGTGATGDSVWLFGPDGRTVVAADVTGTLTPVAGDFDGNGYDDILWYGPGTATDTMWWNGRDGITAEVVPVNGTYEPAAGDFDRNGYDDILWYGSGATVDSIWAHGPAGRTTVAESIPGTGHRPVPADFSRDGHADVLWYVPGTGAEGLWRGQPSGFLKGPAARSANSTDYGTRTLDFDGDGFHEAYWFNATTSSFWRSDSTNFVASQPGPAPVAGVRPVTGDFTGDGRDDLYAYVPGTATDTLWFGQPTGVG